MLVGHLAGLVFTQAAALLAVFTVMAVRAVLRLLPILSRAAAALAAALVVLRQSAAAAAAAAALDFRAVLATRLHQPGVVVVLRLTASMGLHQLLWALAAAVAWAQLAVRAASVVMVLVVVDFQTVKVCLVNLSLVH